MGRSWLLRGHASLAETRPPRSHGALAFDSSGAELTACELERNYGDRIVATFDALQASREPGLAWNLFSFRSAP